MAYRKEDRIEIVNRICDYMVENKASLRNALELHSTPDRKTFYQWLKEDEDFRNQYARACEERADEIFEEILEIADNSNADIEIVEGFPRVSGEAVQRSKLRVDARKWALSKMNPKKYGEKVQQEHSGEITQNIISLGSGKNPEENNAES